MGRKKRYTAEKIIAAIQYTRGMQYLAARHLGCSYETLRKYIKQYPSIRAAIDLERGEMVDLAELKLWEAIDNGQPWAVTLALKHLGKDRGYVERPEESGRDGEGMTLHLQVSVTAQQTQRRLEERLAALEARKLPLEHTPLRLLPATPPPPEESPDAPEPC